MQSNRIAALPLYIGVLATTALYIVELGFILANQFQNISSITLCTGGQGGYPPSGQNQHPPQEKNTHIVLVSRAGRFMWQVRLLQFDRKKK